VDPVVAEPVLTVKEVATALRTHPSTVYRWINSGELEAIRYGRACTCGASVRGGAIRIPASVVEAFQNREAVA
jgi:excisionase family DNA binding protein